MSAKVSFTSAGHLGHPLQQQHITASIPRTSISASASAVASPPEASPPATQSQSHANCPDWHRQNHSSSKLPSFRFADRRPSTSGRSRRASNASNASDSIVCDACNDKGNKVKTVIDDDSIVDASSSPGPSSSAALSQSHPSLAHRVPPSPVSPNPAPCAVPSLPSSADPDPFPGPSDGPLTPFPAQSHQPAAVTGQTFAVTRPLTPLVTAPKLAHQTTTQHNHAEKQSVSASASTPASATTPTSAPSSAPTSAALTSTTSLSSVASPPLVPSRSRASSCQPESPVPVVEAPIQTRRPASFPDTSPANDVAESPHSTSILARARSRRSLVSRRSNGAAPTHPPPSLNHERLQAVEAAQAAQSTTQSSTTTSSSDRSSKDSLPGQRELIPLKTLANSSPPDDRRASVSHRPPVSYRPPVNHNAQPSTSTPVRVPPIRGFRSSGSRKSLTLDMNSRSRIFGDDPVDSNHDRTLRALEGRSDQDFLLSAASVSGRRDTLDGDDTGDVFLKIAREESSRRQPDEKPPSESQSVVSRTTRSSHRRPYSSVVPNSKPTSPPQVRRRLSDQQETSRQRKYDDDRSEVSRVSTFRTFAREKAVSVHPGEELSRTRAGGSTVRASPATPRSMAFQESDGSTYKRRRGGSISDSNSSSQTRGATYRTTATNKTYNSSPLVRSFDLRQPPPETSHAAPEGTESTASTNAPSTVWDELDDLKSRIHRLELTGKLPSTSGAAVSRLSDERPPTATTTVTTMSSSPKRPQNSNQAIDAVSTTSSNRESHPLLHSALSKSKPLLDAEVFRALEAVANDAMALSSMMGSVGQPGPISSGASTIGSGTTVTDRQLRRKADSVCRGLTELCVALGEDRTQTRPQQPQVVQAPAQVPNNAPTTPTVNKTFSGFTSQRRPSFGADQAKANVMTSPRTMSKFEERRLTLLNGSALPAPRATVSTPSTPLEPISRRRSSLLVSRTRRAGTEEPEDGRKSSLMLRTRRAGTEEPDEGRRTSLFTRNRRGTLGEEDDDQVFRSPSRAQTDLQARSAQVTQEPTPLLQAPDNSALASSALPRRRFASSNLNPSRLATPLNTNVPTARRYLDRPNQDRDSNVAERPVEDRAQRHMSLGQSMLSRTSSMIRRPARDSNVTITQSSAAAGGYR
ncbi:hypothetical protein B0T10DRAFT_395942 [Thelonectria olida]|uniref:LPXTG-motif cell wall anchor domain protein n=1 Tax=Thelonectria olida TaxID=1576542 RepID=A0A9P8WHM9_9HYPO|nr:hypothetical protein B0T10DRAFT_395942 [Thelonectria olida]